MCIWQGNALSLVVQHDIRFMSILPSYISEYRHEVVQPHVRSVTGMNNDSFETWSDSS